MNIKKTAFVIILTIITAGAAYFIGVEASQYYHEEKIIENRTQWTEQILEQMPDLRIGDKLPDFQFENLDFESVSLSSVIKGKTVLAIIDPNCHSCIEDIEILIKTAKTDEAFSRFVFISSGNPRYLMDLRDEYNLKSPILYDHERMLMNQFQIKMFPFHIVINKDMIIEEVIAGKMVEDDIIRFSGGM